MKNIGVYVSIGIFLIGIIVSAGKLIAESASTEKRVEKVEVKVDKLEEEGSKELEAIKKENSETQKALAGQAVKQEYIVRQTEDINNKIDKLTDIMLQQKLEKEKKK